MYSYSALNEYANCPLKYKFKRMDKFEEPPTVALQTGDITHKYISEYIKICRDNQYQTYLEFINQIRPANNLIVDDVNNIMQLFIESHVFDWELISDLRSERSLSFDKNWQNVEWESAEAWFRMKIDQYHMERNLLVVSDYKTDRAIPFTQKAFKGKPLLQIPQLAVYAYGVSLLPELQQFERLLIVFDYVRYGLGGVRKREVDREELKVVPSFVENEIKKIELDTEFIPRISSFCDFCGFTMKCPAIQKALIDSGDFIIQNEEEALALAEKVRALKVSLRNYQSKLRAWIENNRSLVVGNEKLDFHPKLLRIYSGNGLIEKILGIIDEKTLYSALHFSETNLRELWKELGLKEHGIKQKDFIESMNEFKEEIVGTEFGFKKIKE